MLRPEDFIWTVVDRFGRPVPAPPVPGDWWIDIDCVISWGDCGSPDETTGVLVSDIIDMDKVRP